MIPFEMRRLGVLMGPEPSLDYEVAGAFNPAAVRGRDGQLYLFPRYVGRRNHSEIGMVRVRFDAAGDPVGVEPLGVVLKPETDYETWPDGRGGCEDPRINFVQPLNHYVMTYTAWSARGPRIAIARSDDLFRWERVGLAQFTPYKDIPLDRVDNKDASVFPILLTDPHGKPSVALLHRPLFPGTRPEEMVRPEGRRPIMPELQSIWISYWHWRVGAEAAAPSGRLFVGHRRVARPKYAWEALKIGAGTPPVQCRHGWLICHHGVAEMPDSTPEHRKFRYSAGVMVLDQERPHHVVYRSPNPTLAPELELELIGAVDGVVFPTGIDRRDDIGQPDRFDVYYGMADDRVGVATFQVPETLPAIED